MIFCVHGFKGNVVKIPILPKAICKFNTIPIKTPMVFAEIERFILKFICNVKGTQTVQKTLKKKVEGPTVSGFKTC